MMAATWSARDFWVAFGNHLWQSTVFAVVAGLLAIALRRNRASVRCGLWLAASVKFLTPFAALAAFGSLLPLRTVAPAARGELTIAIEMAGSPFSPAGSRAVMLVNPAQAAARAHSVLAHFVPAALALTWLCGFLACLSLWLVRWARIAKQARRADPVTGGRELEALRRVEQTHGARGPLTLRITAGSLEPGVFGIFRPVLLWPAGISAHLDDEQMEAILAHEVAHVRRRDNLTAALNMLVQAVFWFHPLVWWLGARMVDERERACDEEVVTAGSNPEVYADGLLRACRFCVESPLACVAGVTGADLKNRVVRIVTQPPARRLGPAGKLLLGTAAVAAVAVPMACGMMHPVTLDRLTQIRRPLPQFTVISIRRDRSAGTMRLIRFTPEGLTASNVPLQELMSEAYGVHDAQIEGAPAWARTEGFDVNARIRSGIGGASAGLTPDDRRQMLRRMLADHFALRLHSENRTMPVYFLVVDKGGAKLARTKDSSRSTSEIERPDKRFFGVRSPLPGELRGSGTPVSVLVRTLAMQPELGGLPVVDRTGLGKAYDWTLRWSPDGEPGADIAGLASAPADLFAALEQQLGLKLEPGRTQMPILVIDHIDHVEPAK